MSGRNRGGRFPMPGPHQLPPGPPGILAQGPRPILNVPQIEQKLQEQHMEIGRLLAENQRLAATHLAMRQDLAGAQGEVQRLQQTMSVMQSDNRVLLDKAASLEAEFRNIEPLKMELHQTRLELQNVALRKNELEQGRAVLGQQLQQLQQDNQAMLADLQKMGALQQEVDGLGQELQAVRSGLEFERQANSELAEQKQGLEQNAAVMAAEIETLKAQLAQFQPRNGQHVNPAYNSQPYMAQEASGHQTPFFNGYGQAGVNTHSSDVAHAGSVAHWPQNQMTPVVHIQPPSVRPTGTPYQHPVTNEYRPAQEFSVAAESHYAADPTSTNHLLTAASEWAEHKGPENKTFYFNKATGVSQWEKPEALAALQRQQQQPPVPHVPPPPPSQQQQQLHQHLQQPRAVQQPPAPAMHTVPGQQKAAGIGSSPRGQPFESGRLGPGPGPQPHGKGQAHLSAPPVMHQKSSTPEKPSIGGGPPGMKSQIGGNPNLNKGSAAGSLFVFGVPDEYNDQKLAGLFAPYGAVTHAKIGIDKETGRSKGYGFVSFELPQAAEAAIAGVNGKLINGRRVRVEKKRGEFEPHSENQAQTGRLEHHQQQPQQQQQQQQPMLNGGPIRSFGNRDSRSYRPY